MDIGLKLCPGAEVSVRKRLPEATSHRVISPCVLTVASALPSELNPASTGEVLSTSV